MAELALTHSQTDAQPKISISLEVLVYAALLVLVMALRLVQLGAIPLNDSEAHEALAALQRVEPEDNEVIFPLNALGALFNTISFTLFGASDTGARLPTAVAGILLAFSPLLYRRWLGSNGTLLIALGIGISPVALLASRSMSGMVWALLLVMLGGWFTLRFAESRQKGFSLAATICGAGVLLLTTPYGILILLGLFCGVTWGVLGGSAEDRRAVPEIAALWSGLEALIAAGVAVAVVATGFFTVPQGFSGVAQGIETFFAGLSQRPPNISFAYSFWVSLRYDFAFLLFGVLGIWLAGRDSTFLERFLTGWLAWGILACIFYPGGTAELALINTIPAVGLTASLVLRLLASTSYGFWEVPRWLLPLHSLVVAGLLVSMGVNLQSMFGKLQEEAKPVAYAENLEISSINGNNVRFGTLNPDGTSSGMTLSLPYVQLKNCRLEVGNRDAAKLRQDAEGRFCEFEETREVTLQVIPLDDGARSAAVSITNIAGETVYGPTLLGDELRFTFESPQDDIYTLRLADGQSLSAPVQYMTLVFAGDLLDKSGLEKITSGALLLEVPRLHALFLIGSRFPNRVAIIVVLMLLLIIPITFFISGAFYGSRAAWRGVGLGFLLYFALYGIGVAWGAGYVHGGDARELWYTQSVPQEYHSLQETLRDYSRRDNGLDYDLHITVQGERDSALGWALHRFRNTRFVSQLNPSTSTPVVIAPDTLPRPRLGADYVGQALILDNAWDRASLNWTDFGSWLFTRKARFDPVARDPWRLWVQKELYDVLKVPEQ